MKTVVILVSSIVLALSGVVTSSQIAHKTKSVDATFVERQKKILALISHIQQFFSDADYYQLGKDYDIEANIKDYTNKQEVEKFIALYRNGLLPKHYTFSIFNKKMREEAILLFHIFYYAKDFDTFYKTAAFARVYVNEAQFLYAFYAAIMHREDTFEFVLPPPYEIFPQYYTDSNVLNKVLQAKIQGQLLFPELASQYGVIQENENYIFFANYSNSLSYYDEEQKLSYFMEDIGLNTYYYYFHMQYPFWMDGREFQLPIMKERRGEVFYFFYQRLLARYYLERLSHGIGKIQDFSWQTSFKTGYRPLLHIWHPFVQRNGDYQIVTEENYEDLRFLEAYEQNFVEFLENSHFKAFNKEIDLHDAQSINFVGNYWQSNFDLYEKTQPRHYWQSYQEIARRVLSATSPVTNEYTILPSALESYQTSLRDPAFYQLYSRIVKYILEYKKHLKPHTASQLYYEGVKITDVQIDPLITYFDYFDYDVTNGLYFTKEEYKSYTKYYKVRQPRLNHKHFTVKVSVTSYARAEVVGKIFLGPKYDHNGYSISLEDNWMNFLEIDWFTYNLTQGTNLIERNCEQFQYFQDDQVSLPEIYKLLEKKEIPVYNKFLEMPRRLVLPKGTATGFPYQIFVIIYPSETTFSPLYQELKSYVHDMKPLTYPLDRPPKSIYFNQPNMYFKDILIHHEGEEYTYRYNIPGYSVNASNVHKN